MELTSVSQSDARPKRTLWQLLDAVKANEEALEDPTLDPAELVGKIDPTMADLRAKVDGIRRVVEEMEQKAAAAQAKVAFWQKKAKARSNNAQRLLDYVLREMQLGQFDLLPGTEVMLKRVVHHTPSLVAKREPTPRDALELGDDFVEEVPISYRWNSKAVKDALLGGTDDNLLLDAFGLEYSEKVSFVEREDIAPPQKPQKKGKRK